METKKITYSLYALIVLGSVAVLSLFSKENTVSVGGSTADCGSITTVTTSSVTRTVTQLVAANARRECLQVQNHSTSTLYCLLDGASTAASSSVTSTPANPIGFTIQPSSTANPGGQLFLSGYTGALNCTGDTNGASTTVTTFP